MVFYTFFKGMIVAFAIMDLVRVQRERTRARAEVETQRMRNKDNEAWRHCERVAWQPLRHAVIVPDTMPEELT